jgi:hypothetical protein
MCFSKIRHSLKYVLRYWLIIVIVLFLGFAIAVPPTLWAAPVSAPSNQTVPRSVRLYLPLIKYMD